MKIMVAVDKAALRDLGDGDHDTVRLYQRVRGMVLDKLTRLRIFNHITEDRALVHDTDDALPVFKMNAVKLGIVEFILRSCDLIAANIDGHILRAVADGCSGDIHSRIACTDNGNPLTEFIDVGIVQIIDRVEDVTECLARNAELARSPRTGSEEYAGVAVVQKILYAGRSAEVEVRAEQNAHLTHSLIVAVENRLGQTELRYAIAEDAADLLASLKDRDLIAAAGKDDRNGDAGRTCTDDADLHPVGRCAGKVKSLKA